VPRERLELSILAAVASKTTVYTIPPPGHKLTYNIIWRTGRESNP